VPTVAELAEALVTAAPLALRCQRKVSNVVPLLWIATHCARLYPC
jgi:hypothetical protein